MSEQGEWPAWAPGIPEGCVPIVALAVVLYITPEGRQGYRIAETGEAPLSTLLGLLRLAEFEILRDQAGDTR